MAAPWKHTFLFLFFNFAFLWPHNIFVLFFFFFFCCVALWKPLVVKASRIKWIQLDFSKLHSNKKKPLKLKETKFPANKLSSAGFSLAPFCSYLFICPFFFQLQSISMLRVSDAGHNMTSWQRWWVFLASLARSPAWSLKSRLSAWSWRWRSDSPPVGNVAAGDKTRKASFFHCRGCFFSTAPQPTPSWSERGFLPLDELILTNFLWKMWKGWRGRRKSYSSFFSPLFSSCRSSSLLFLSIVLALGGAAAGLIIASLWFCRCVTKLPPSTHSIIPPPHHDLIKAAIRPATSLAAAAEMILMLMQFQWKKKEKHFWFLSFRWNHEAIC